jgi:SOS-response transcriptional repressor LexA
MKTSISFRAASAGESTLAFMTKDKAADRLDKAIGDRIRQVRERHEPRLTQEQFAKRLGVTRGAVGNWELGKGVKRENLSTISKEFDVSFDWLATGGANEPALSGPVIERTGSRPAFAGFVQAGQFLAVDEYFQQDGYPVPEFVLTVQGYGRVRQYAYQARGDSMTEAGIRDGMWVVAADAADFIDAYGDLETGDLVVVERTRHQGAERELTVKEIRFYRNRYELHPRSTNEEHKPIIVPHDPKADPDAIEIKIVGVVLTAYADLRRPRRGR